MWHFYFAKIKPEDKALAAKAATAQLLKQLRLELLAYELSCEMMIVGEYSTRVFSLVLFR